jgi:hypothetical protein
MDASGRYVFPTQPVVFLFQPTEYEFVPPDRLSDWEADMRELVGLPVDLEEAPGGGTWSRCGPGSGEGGGTEVIIPKDDCDMATLAN